jgi:hypothetical protein
MQKVFFKRPAIVKHMKCHTRPLGDGDWQVSEFSAATVAAKIGVILLPTTRTHPRV